MNRRPCFKGAAMSREKLRLLLFLCRLLSGFLLRDLLFGLSFLSRPFPFSPYQATIHTLVGFGVEVDEFFNDGQDRTSKVTCAVRESGLMS